MTRILIGLMFSIAITAQTDVDRIVARLDDLYRSDSSLGTLEMTVTTPHYERQLSMNVWSKGMDYTLVRILSPRKEKGVSSLKRDRDMWHYLPKVKKLVRIPPSMMMSSWMGSDFTNDDLVRESSWQQDYRVEKGRDDEEELELIFIPREGAAVTWSKVVTVFEKAREIPKQQDFYDEKQRLVRTMVFSDVRDMGGKTLPVRMTLTPLLKEGHQTVVEYRDLSFNLDIEDSLFTVRHLRSGR